MSYREKSAWVMALVMIGAGFYYLKLAVSASNHIGATAPPFGILVAYVLVVIAGSVAAQIALAISSPTEANCAADERERPLLDRAGHWSGCILAGGAVTSLLYFLARGDSFLLFHMVMASLILSQIAEYVFQIVLLRRSA